MWQCRYMLRTSLAVFLLVIVGCSSSPEAIEERGADALTTSDLAVGRMAIAHLHQTGVGGVTYEACPRAPVALSSQWDLNCEAYHPSTTGYFVMCSGTLARDVGGDSLTFSGAIDGAAAAPIGDLPIRSLGGASARIGTASIGIFPTPGPGSNGVGIHVQLAIQKNGSVNPFEDCTKATLKLDTQDGTEAPLELVPNGSGADCAGPFALTCAAGLRCVEERLPGGGTMHKCEQ